MTEVFMDGIYVGGCEKGREFSKKLIEQRRSGKLPTYLNTSYSEEEDTVTINTINGRLRRPLIVVKKGIPLIDDVLLEKVAEGTVSWSDLIEKGYIEYLDAEEEENAYVSVSPGELTP